MFSRISFLALLFVGLVSLLPREAMAQFPPILDAGWVDWSSSGTTASTLACDLALGGGTSSIDLANLSESGSGLTCALTEGTTVLPSDPGGCTFSISYSQLTSTCTQNGDGTSTLNVTGACGIASVSGSLTCTGAICGAAAPGPCIATLGVSTNNCAKTFPAVGSFLVGEIANASASTPNNTCTGAIAHLGNMRIRYCGGFPLPAFDCGTPGSPTVSAADTSLFLMGVDGTVTQSVQTTCGGNKDQGAVTLTIPPEPTVDPARIDPTSVRLENVLASSCTLKGGSLVCKVSSCPDLGPALFALPRNADGTVNAEITGSLLPVAGQAGETPFQGNANNIVLSTK